MKRVYKNCHRLLALVLALLLVFPPVQPVAAESDTAYSEEFPSLTENWSSVFPDQWIFNTEGGTVIAPAAANRPLYLFKDYSEGLSNYTFEADVTLPDTSATLGGICFGVQDQGDVTSRYEFTVSYYNGGWCPKIYKRVINVDGYSGYVCAGDHQTVNSNVSITPGVPFTMKVTLSGKKMTAYINNVQVLSDTVYFWESDASYNEGTISGGVGLMGFNNVQAVFDNAKLYVNNTLAFYEDFTDIDYETYTGTVIYADDFSQADTSWEGGTFSTSGISYNLTIADGVASVIAPETGTVDKAMSVSLNRPASEMEGYTNYCVKTTAKITGDAKTPTARKGTAVLRFAQDVQTSEIYELRLVADGQLQVYRGSTLLLSKNLATITGQNFQYGSTYVLRAYVYDDVALLSVNNCNICVFNDFGADGISGYAAIRAIAGSVEFDNFVTASMDEQNDSELLGISIYSKENGAVVGSDPLYRFDTQNYLLICKYVDGTSVPVNMEKATISNYDPSLSSQQQITVTYSGKTCSLCYEPALFRDGFTGTGSDRWSISGNSNLPYKIQDGQLIFTYNTAATTNAAVVGQVSDGALWNNYAVSADVNFTADNSTQTRYFGLQGRYADNSWYEFRLIYGAGGKMSAVLARFDNSAYVPLLDFTDAQLRICTQYTTSLSLGKQYNLKLSMTGDLLKVYFNGALLGSYRDTSENALSQGTAGMRVINNSCTVDNFAVKAMGDDTISSFGLSQFPDGNVTVYQGNSIEIWNNDLVVTYADGTVEKVTLQNQMLGSFDSTQLGEQNLNITYVDQTLPIMVTVVERPAYVTSFCDTLSAFSSQINSSNVSAFGSLKTQYDSLSGYEATSIGQELLEKYHRLLSLYDIYLAPELADDELLVNETLETDVLKNWGNSIEGNGGTWIQINGLLYQAQRAYMKSVTGWKCPDVYGNITGISADLTLYSDNMYAGVGINVSNDGYYHACVANTSTDTNGNRVYELQLYRKLASSEEKVASINLADKGISLAHGTWFQMLMTIDGSTIRVYIDGQETLSWQETDTLFDSGEAGVRIARGDALVDNVRIYGTAQDRTDDSSALVYATNYVDVFEDETAGESPSHWVENYTSSVTTDNWKIYDKDSKVYGTDAAGYTETYLYVFDNDPTVSTSFMVSNLSEDGAFGFITRMAPSTAFVLVGYDAVQEKWFVKSQISEAEGVQYTYQEGIFSLELNRWYNACLSLEGKELRLIIDDIEVLQVNDVQHTGYGRIGFYTQDASLFVDNYAVTLASGDIPQDGIVSYVIDEDTYNNMFEIETFDDGQNLLGVGIASKFVSDDAGLTWNEVTSDSKYAQVIAANYTTLLEMSNGKYMQILSNNEMKVQLSDDLLNWTTVSTLVPAEDYTNNAGSRVTLLHVNSATEVKLDNGQSRIFVPVSYRKYQTDTKFDGHYTEVYYSDDFGYTWQKSTNNTLDVLPGATESDSSSWAESKVIKCADGSLRMYYSRNTFGCMQYTVSNDNGATWEGLYQIPYIQLPMTSYAIMEDPACAGTFYMVCCIGKTTYLGSIYPRTRFVLLRSTDGMNWEFLMNIERMTEHSSSLNGTSLYQILDPSLLITQDYVYITIGRSEREYSANNSNSHQAQRVYYVRAEKDKLQGRAWDASTIADMYYPQNIEFEDMPQTAFDLSEEFSCEGTLKLTDFLGNETVVSISDCCTLYETPSTSELGEVTVGLYYKNGTDLSYTVDVYDAYQRTEMLHNEDFSETPQENWTGAINSWTWDSNSGTWVAPANIAPVYLNRDSGYELCDYTFEADITLPAGVSNSTQLGGICFGIQDTDTVTSRYEFSVSYKDGGWCPRIYKRVSNVAGYAGYFCAGDHQKVDSNVSITPGVPFTMKVKLNDLNVKAYIDDILIFDFTVSSKTDATFAAGSITGGVGLMGFKTKGASFDNVKLYRYTSIGYRENFENTDKLLLDGNGWTTDATSFTSYQSQFWKLAADDGNQYLAMRNRNYGLLYDTGEHNRNYVWEADMFYDNIITAADGTSTEATPANNGNAGIFFGLDKDTGLGYEFCLIYNGSSGVWKCRLYNRAETSINISAALPDGVTFDENTTVTLRVVLDGATANCYVNGKLAISHTRTDGVAISGNTALVSRLGGSSSVNDLVTYFDNVAFLHTPGAQVVKDGTVVDAYATAVQAQTAAETVDYGGEVSVSVLLCQVTYVADGKTVERYYVAQGQSVEDIPAIPVKKGYTGQWNHDGTNITEDTTIYAVYTADITIDTWSLSLGDDIGINFYASIANVANTVVNITVGGETTTVKATDAQIVDGKYCFSANIAAAQMMDTITVELVCGDIYVRKEYSVRQYADFILDDANDYDETTKKLVKEMLNYGAAAQTYFGYSTHKLADSGIYETGLSPVPETAQTEISVSGRVSGISYYGATLVFGSKTAIRYYFNVTGDINSYTFTDDQTTYKPVSKDGLYYVEVADINPQDLADAITMNVNDTLSVTYSPMNYMVRMSVSGNENLKNLLKAMYNYHLAAVEYAKNT